LKKIRSGKGEAARKVAIRKVMRMQTKTQFEQLMADPEFRRLYAIEGLITEAGEFIARLMQEQGVSKAELARRLGRSRAYVTRLLSGSANMTIRTLAEVAYALGAEVKLRAEPIETAERDAVGSGMQDRVWWSGKLGGWYLEGDTASLPTKPPGRLRPDPAGRFCYAA